MGQTMRRIQGKPWGGISTPGVVLRLLSAVLGEILLAPIIHNQLFPGIPMRSFILSVSGDRWLTPLRNAVLAHAGYAVIPASTAEKALEILLHRHVSAIVIGNSIAVLDRERLCSEGKRRGVPSVILDRGTPACDVSPQTHIDPTEGPEAVLSAIASVLAKTEN
jgi:hypothetical protein